MIDLDVEALGKRVAHYRRLNGISADQLAERAGLGITRDVIANIEYGRRKDVGIRLLAAIAAALRVPLIALVLPLERPEDKVGDGLSAIEALREMQGWEPDLTSESGRKVAAQLAALRTYLVRKDRLGGAIFDKTWPSDRSPDSKTINENIDRAQQELNEQREVLRGLGIELPDDG